MNLLEELIEVLEKHGKDLDDITHVFGEYYRISFYNFLDVARKTTYDRGYGSQVIAKDLTITGDDFWVTRAEYDGQEWFEYHTMPKVPAMIAEIKYLASDQENGHGYESLVEINKVYLDDIDQEEALQFTYGKGCQ